MEHKNCLNCGEALTGKFCAECGQKADTHRISPKHFLLHDLLHGFWHIDKGILYTLKQTFTRPGHAALDYIAGRRIRYYNVFYLTLIALGLTLLISHFMEQYEPMAELEGDGEIIYNFIAHNIKYIILCFIPLFALNGFIIFRRPKLNYAEHMIIAGYALLGCIVIALFFNLLSIALISFRTLLWSRIDDIQSFASLYFPIWVYFQVTRRKYKIPGFIWRIVFFYFLFLIEIIIAFILGMIIANGGNFEGKIMI